MSCVHCGGSVKMVPPVVAEHIARAIPEGPVRHRILAACFSWLVTRHEGVEHYLGIRGRSYTDEERDTIAQDSGAVQGTPCPFATQEGGCLLPGGLGEYMPPPSLVVAPLFGWLPTLLTREWDRAQLAALIDERAIADAKVLLGTRTWPLIHRTPDGGFIAA